MAAEADTVDREHRGYWWSITQWRHDELERAGWPAVPAMAIADRHDIDLHVACDLVRKGCPIQRALDILL